MILDENEHLEYLEMKLYLDPIYDAVIKTLRSENKLRSGKIRSYNETVQQILVRAEETVGLRKLLYVKNPPLILDPPSKVRGTSVKLRIKNRSVIDTVVSIMKSEEKTLPKVVYSALIWALEDRYEELIVKENIKLRA